MVHENNNEIIQFLYKYRIINEYFFDSLENHYLYFSSPQKFNDPFDCKLFLTWEGEPEEVDKWIIKFMKEKATPLLKYFKKIDYDPVIISQFKEPIDQELQNTLILSLSEVNDSILMWSHYAEDHKGLCLGFRTCIENSVLGIMFEEDCLKIPVPNVPKGFLRAQSINYSVDMPPPFNPLRDDISAVFKFIFSKHTNWSYERERRIVLSTGIATSPKLKFRKNTLNQIIFGMRTPDDIKEKIKDLIRRKYSNNEHSINFFQAIPVEGKYKLEIRRL